ncbi:IclR family transcriptional regulator [Paenibacillus thalictri]|uniref:IclR family transcriptional regulator n=1 Tax=Paenibacillus thalictri TaxID=2527873 RepID=A0A4V2J3L7_9BACL|nr:IclR family transcriptional regulator [Paenibacillus thalictri]TBL73297.1 IclR family transcriptional regulator [Paenibacillus thalictri]
MSYSEETEEKEEKGNGIQSVELGLNILKQIARQSKSLNITEISHLTGLSKSKLHRYLTSFCRSGVLEKHEDLRYSLGRELILLGVKAAEKLDVKELSAPYLTYLKDSLNETVALAIWGEQGPFYIRWEASNRAVNIGIRAGSQVSVILSAPGKLFVANLPEEQTQALVKMELANSAMNQATFYNEIRKIRENGVAVAEGTIIQGITAISCPVFDQNNQMAAAVTVVGLSGALDASLESDAVKLIREQALALSKSLGYQQKP